MKPTLLPTSPAAAPDSEPHRPSRRRVVAGAGVAAGAALAAAALPGAKRDAATQGADATAARKPADGYRLTEHIRRYYDTTRS